MALLRRWARNSMASHAVALSGSAFCAALFFAVTATPAIPRFRLWNRQAVNALGGFTGALLLAVFAPLCVGS